MEFLDRIFLDNTIKSYLLIFGTITFVILIKRLLSHSIASLLFLVVKRNWKNIDKKAFISLIIKPLAWLISVSVSVFALDKLNFPEVFLFKIYGHATDEIFQKAGITLIIIYFFFFLLSLIDFIALIFEEKAKQTKDKRDDQLIVFFRDFLKVIFSIFGFIMIIKAGFNQNVGTVITGLSIVGAALALAAKESMENLIASFVIFFDKPFYTGDLVKVNNVSGTVEHIGLRSTRIRTMDKTLVTVPNKQMVDSVVDNLSMRSQRRAEIKLEFLAKSNTKNLELLVTGIEKIFKEKPEQIIKSSAFLTEFNKNGAIITVEYFTSPFPIAEYNALKQQINISIKKLVEELKLTLASAGSEINIFGNDPNAAAPKSQPII